MAVMNPTYYGPAAQYASATGNQTAGSLACAVQQDSRMTLRDDGPELVEKFKCPTDSCMVTGGSQFAVFGAKFQPGLVRPDIVSNASFVSRFPVPTTDAGWNWIIRDVDVEQLTPGDHCLVTVRSDLRNDDEESSLSGIVSVDGDHWDLVWQPENMSVLAYCKNESKPPAWKRFLPDVNGDILKSDDQPSQFSNARYVKECASGSKYNARWGQIGAWEWVRNQSVYELNDNEKKTFNYYVNGINPQLHVPVLTHTKTLVYHKSLDTRWVTIAGKVIHIPPEGIVGKVDECVTAEDLGGRGCPYRDILAEGWKWLKTGEQIREINEKTRTTYQLTEEFTGAKKWSGDFYKGGTWSINGQVPQDPWEIGER